MNNHQNTTFYQLGHFIKTCRSPAGTSFNKIPNSAKSVILLIIPIYAKFS
ncbi:Mobile element protein [uncultured Candidatus Thioglobus sp.]|nr:Mobile element protein [uncultured Candidatus Thioglobus sp.]